MFFELLRWALNRDALDHSRALHTFMSQLGHIEFANYWHQVRRAQALGFDLGDAFSAGQIESKLWMVEMMRGVLPSQGYNIGIVAGWLGVLPRLLYWLAPELVRRMTIIEIDPKALATAKILNADLLEKRVLDLVEADARDFDYGMDYNLIVNCAGEHFGSDEWYQQVPPGRLMVIQSTNMPQPDHVQLVHSALELLKLYPLELSLYGGTTYLPGGRRYMRIGRK